MRLILLSIAILTAFANRVYAQSFSYQLTGSPMVTTGWTFGGSTGSGFVNTDEFVLTQASTTQSGYIYYTTPQNLTACSQFTAYFEFKISNSSSPTADGIAFWYITNPPTTFINGLGLGIPTNPNGLVMYMDTYDNNGNSDNPIIGLRYINGTTSYAEALTTGQTQIGNQATSQSTITNGSWHTCLLTYYYGSFSISIDGNTPIVTATNYPLTITSGYFGFSASTGASYSRQSIRNVQIDGAPEPPPPVGTDVTYCQGATAVPLTQVSAAPDSTIRWYTTPTGGVGSVTAPTPSTAVAGIVNYYVSAVVPDCNLESLRDTVTVTINAKPATPTVIVPNYCSDQVSYPFVVSGGTNLLWYTDSVGGTGDPVAPVVSTLVADTFNWWVTVTSSAGCESDRKHVVAVVHPTPVVDFDYGLGYACGVDTVKFTNNEETNTYYTWDYGDGNYGYGANPYHIYSGQGTFDVVLKAQTDYCQDSLMKAITIYNPLDAAFTVSADTVCNGTAVTFTNTTSANVINGTSPTYFWNFADGNYAQTFDATHQFNVPGVYNVMMIVTNAVPCSDTAWKAIYVDSIPEMFLNILDTSVCVGHKIDASATGITNGLSNLIWNFGDSNDSLYNVNPTTHAYDDAGVYSVSLLADYRACADIPLTRQVTIKALPHIDLGPDTSVCIDGAPLLLKDEINAANASATWLWSTGDTTSYTYVKHDGPVTGTVTIDQCSTSDVVEVKKNCYIDIPNSFTPTGDGNNDYFFPRQLLSGGVAGFSMMIFDRWGQKIFETTNAVGRGWDGKFNGKDQPTGVYVYLINVVFSTGRQEQYTGNVTLLR
ncbi:MAG: PKD domain-containing protein [Edaphocola sp.]